MSLPKYLRSNVLAVQEGFVKPDPNSRSLIGRIRLSTKTQWRRLLIWFVTVIISSISIGLLLPKECYTPHGAIHTAVSVLAEIVGFAVFVYALSIFALDRQVRPLLVSAAFFAISSGVMLQVVYDFRRGSPCNFGWITMSAWLISAVLLVGAGYTKSVWRSANRLQAIGHFSIAGMIVLAFPLAVLPYVLDPSILSNLSYYFISIPACRLIVSAIHASAMALMCWALIKNYRLYINESDGPAGLTCYFLMASAAGLLFTAFSGERFDKLHLISQICFAWSWLAIIVGNGVENAFAHKEAGNRLEELETLHEVSWSLVGARTVKELLDLFVATLVNKLGTRIAAVYLSQEPDTLELATACGSEQLQPGTKYPLVASGPRPGFHSGHTAKAFTSREVQVALDVFIDVEFVQWRVIAGDNGCAASIPLVDRDSCIGVLNVYFSESSQLTAARLRLMTTIAAAATSAIEYAISKESHLISDTDSLDLAA